MQQPGMQYQGGMQQQPVIPQMEYGQQYQGMPPQQQMNQNQQQEQKRQAQPTPPEPASPPASAERDDLGVPAFLRRPTRK